MEILLIAPQPFYHDRGTPIAVDMLLKNLSTRGDNIDVVTYHRGQKVDYDNVRILRIPNIPFIRQIPAGYSINKLFCDILLFFKVISLVLMKKYHLVHAVEEGVFIALFINIVLKIPFVYDMDSSLTEQLAEQKPLLFSVISPLLHALESLAVRKALVVVPVCDALVKDIEKYTPEKVMVLRDFSLLRHNQRTGHENLRKQLHLRGTIILYIGNLNRYQGIDLLIESFALVVRRNLPAHLVIIGGNRFDIAKYQGFARFLHISSQVHFIGRKPIQYLSHFLSQADILVSPRIKGNNTPMKIYSYMDSGKPILATDLSTHTQVLTDQVALLAEPEPEAFAEALALLIENEPLRHRLGIAAKRLAEEHYTSEVYQRNATALYNWIAREIGQDFPPQPPNTFDPASSR